MNGKKAKELRRLTGFHPHESPRQYMIWRTGQIFISQESTPLRPLYNFVKALYKRGRQSHLGGKFTER